MQVIPIPRTQAMRLLVHQETLLSRSAKQAIRWVKMHHAAVSIESCCMHYCWQCAITTTAIDRRTASVFGQIWEMSSKLVGACMGTSMGMSFVIGQVHMGEKGQEPRGGGLGGGGAQ